MSTRSGGLGSRLKVLLVQYLDEGTIGQDELRELDYLNRSEEFALLPRTPGSFLQSALYLMRQTLCTLRAVGEGRTDDGQKLLSEALRRVVENSRSASGSGEPVADPFEGLLVQLAERLELTGSHVQELREAHLRADSRDGELDETMRRMLDSLSD